MCTSDLNTDVYFQKDKNSRGRQKQSRNDIKHQRALILQPK